MNKNFLVSVYILLCVQNGSCSNVLSSKMLVPGKNYSTNLNAEQKLCIYCYRGIQKHLLHIWQTAYLLISLEPSEYDLYKGDSVNDVLLMYENQKNSWTNQIISWKSNRIDLDPFSLNCIGINTELDHTVLVNIIRIDLWRIVRVASGIFMFLASSKLSSNPIFYYICGVSFGIAASFLIAVYLLSKLIPKKPTLYAFFIGGWAVGVYLFQIIWQNIRNILINYHVQVLLYMFVTGLISFVICYRLGPVTDPRTKNLIKWTLQVVSLILIFYSTRCEEASVFFVLTLLVYYYFPKKLSLPFVNLWRWIFPQKVKLLTEDEYHEQGVKETIRALDSLRKFCSSSECNQWKTILSLKQPVRFAEFIEGSSHLDDSEILAYESESQKTSVLLTDDSEASEAD